MTVKAVLIDIDNTILDFDKCSEESIKQCAEHFGITLPENYFAVFSECNDKLWHLLEEGIITKQDIYDRRWVEIFKRLGIDADGVSFDNLFREKIREIAIPVEGADELLRYLSEKYPVYCASNASRERQEHRLSVCGLGKYLSGIFTSEDIGFQKPAKEFFFACHSALYPVKASEIVMIGDSVNADIIGAKNFGMKAIWFNYRNEAYSDYNFTDYTVNSIKEIMNIL